MTQVESSIGEFEKRNAALVIIAAQKIEGFAKAKEFVEKQNYRFPLLFDENRKVTRAYGVYHAFGIDAINIAHPATFVIGRDRKIDWIAVSPNQLERPPVEDILNAID